MPIPPAGPAAPPVWQDLPESQLSPEQKAQFGKVVQDFMLDIMIDPTEILMED